VLPQPSEAAIIRVNPFRRIPVPWVFMLGYLVGLGIQVLVPFEVGSTHRVLVQSAGFVLLAIGLVLAASALGLFRKANTTTVPFERPSNLVTSGPYRFTRNPMYVALSLVYLGVEGTRVEIWPLVVLPLILAYVNYRVIPVEERHLAEIFGESYAQYRSRVRRWF
jgi:protein-S-isoprenylcysteine O-methyltransferase Ste14